MSDIKLYDLKNKTEIEKVNAFDVKKIIEERLLDVFQIDIIAKDLRIDENNSDAISYLGLDDNMQLVIIEYRYGKFGSLTKKGLFYIDYIKDHISRFKMLINDYKKGIAEQVNYNARLVVFCDDANSYDHYAIKHLPYTIELIQLHFYDSYLAFEKVYQSRKVDHSALKINLKNNPHYELYKYISDYMLSLGDEVCETGVDSYIIYRKINSFAYLFFSNKLVIKYLVSDKYKTKEINDINSFESIMEELEKSYDEH